MRKSKFIQWTNPIRLEKLTHVMKVRGVDVYIHWTVFLIVAFFILGAIQNPGSTLVGLASYLAMIWIHETGHLIAAHRRGSEVFEIEIYPILGITRFQTPWSRLDHCIIAWGGVIAQAIVAIPLVLWVTVFGFTPFQSLNAMFAILGYFSLCVAAFNLLPVPRLDGAIAWGIVPALIERAKLGRKQPPEWRR